MNPYLCILVQQIQYSILKEVKEKFYDVINLNSYFLEIHKICVAAFVCFF